MVFWLAVLTDRCWFGGGDARRVAVARRVGAEANNGGLGQPCGRTRTGFCPPPAQVWGMSDAQHDANCPLDAGSGERGELFICGMAKPPLD